MDWEDHTIAGPAAVHSSLRQYDLVQVRRVGDSNSLDLNPVPRIPLLERRTKAGIPKRVKRVSPEIPESILKDIDIQKSTFINDQ